MVIRGWLSYRSQDPHYSFVTRDGMVSKELRTYQCENVCLNEATQTVAGCAWIFPLIGCSSTKGTSIVIFL